MRKRIRVVVTADDAVRGVRGVGFDCPFALALKRRLDALNVLVLPEAAFALGRRYEASPRAFNAILDYDMGAPMRTGTYYYSIGSASHG